MRSGVIHNISLRFVPVPIIHTLQANISNFNGRPTPGVGGVTTNTPFECFVHPCLKPFVLSVPISNTTPTTKNVTALAGISFRNMSTPELVSHKDELKASLSRYINSTIDNLASGHITRTFTNCVPVDGKRCPMIIGIIRPLPGSLF